MNAQDSAKTEVTTSIFVCGRPRVNCSSHDCSERAVRACDFPVKRGGAPSTCERPVCGGCVVTIDGKHYCRAHGVVVKAKAAAEARKP